jgi:hypothetical protein
MSERDNILKINREPSSTSNGMPKSKAGFLILFVAKNINAMSNFIHKWGKP